MADKKISEYAAKSPTVGGDYTIMVQTATGVNYKVTWGTILGGATPVQAGYLSNVTSDIQTQIDALDSQINSPPFVRYYRTATSGNPTPNADTTDVYILTNLSENATFQPPSGTPREGQRLIIRVTNDNSIARSLDFTSSGAYRASTGLALPTIGIVNKTMYLSFIYNAEALKWDYIGSLGGF